MSRWHFFFLVGLVCLTLLGSPQPTGSLCGFVRISMAAEHQNSRILPILWFVDGCWLDGDIVTGCQERDSQDGAHGLGSIHRNNHFILLEACNFSKSKHIHLPKGASPPLDFNHRASTFTLRLNTLCLSLLRCCPSLDSSA